MSSGSPGRVAAEQQGGHGGGLHDPLEVVHHRQLHPRVGTARAQAGGDVDRLDGVVGIEQVAHPITVPNRQERLDHRHQPPLRQVGDGAPGGLQRRRRARVAQTDPGEHLAALEAAGLDLRGRVAGEPVVELEGRALQAAAVHRADDDPILQGTHEQQVVQDVGGAEHPVHAGAGDRSAQPVQQLDPAAHGHGVVAHAQAPRGPGGRRRRSAAGRPPAAADDGSGSPRRRRCGQALWL